MIRVGDIVCLNPKKGKLFESCYIGTWRNYLGREFTVIDILPVTGSILLSENRFYWPPNGLMKVIKKHSIQWYLEKRNGN